jgi:hypothetical protein
VQFVQRGNQGIKVTSGNLKVKPAGSLNLATPGLKVVKFIVADVGEAEKHQRFLVKEAPLPTKQKWSSSETQAEGFQDNRFSPNR